MVKQNRRATSASGCAPLKDILHPTEQYSLYIIVDSRLGHAIHRLSRRSLNALPITETELKLIAAAAMMGLRRMPKNG